jgi:transcriptional regulator with XRE-family HTH domain
MREPHPLIVELAARRKAAGWSARAAALKAGLGESAVLDWERGRANPTVGALEQYLNLFGLTLTAAGDPVRLLSLEMVPARPTGPVVYPPVTPAVAAWNRQVLADALGIVDDMPAPGTARMVRGEAA